MKRFLGNSAISGIVLFSSAFLAIILSNSSYAHQFENFWNIKFSIGFDKFLLSKNLHHWINDGLMAVFFFVVGLELKREIIAGELNNIRKSILPLVAAVGGMAIPALIYLFFNASGSTSNGWGIPMATDIAFALGVLYLLGNKVPVTVKIFLTALAIADDLGAVLVIAFFYTSNIDMTNLLIGLIFMIVLVIGNLAGVRATWFYGIIGIGGLWMAFLMSGVHATIAAVLAAFTIPANVSVGESAFAHRAGNLLSRFRMAEPNQKPTVTSEQLGLLENLRLLAKKAQTPLQRLEHALHPFVAFIILPIFALSNAGIEFSGELVNHSFSPVSLGVFFGLLLGKPIGIIAIVLLLVKLRMAKLPEGMNTLHLVGLGFLGAIGFTMSLFVSELAFVSEEFKMQAKLGIIAASVLASLVGFLIFKIAIKRAKVFSNDSAESEKDD